MYDFMNIFSGDWWDNFYPTHVFPITRVALDYWSKFPSQTVRDPVWFLILSSGLHWCCHRLRCSPADTYNRPHWLSQNFTYPPTSSLHVSLSNLESSGNNQALLWRGWKTAHRLDEEQTWWLCNMHHIICMY